MPGTDARPPLRIAIVGAESTGKSVLSHALVDALAGEFGLRCAVVDEYLREWCEQQRRTPRLDEQMGIALEHGRRIDAAAAQPGVDVVVCDTTPLMVSVYSDMLFGVKQLWLTVILYALFTTLSVAGLRSWRALRGHVDARH